MALIRRETDYAFRALARLAEVGDYVPVSALAHHQEVPEVFLRKIMQRLQHAGFVESRQGPFGGYRLARPAKEVTFLEVIEAMQGPLIVNECFLDPGICSRTSDCPVRRRLRALQDDVRTWLKTLRLSDVAEKAKAHEGK